MYSVYILYSKSLDRFYIGFTGELLRRMDFHKNAETQKFTAKADDWELFYQLICESKKQALAIEIHIKKMKSKGYIQNLKKYPEMGQKLLLKFKS